MTVFSFFDIVSDHCFEYVKIEKSFSTIKKEKFLVSQYCKSK